MKNCSRSEPELLICRETGEVPEQLSRRIPLVRVPRYSGMWITSELSVKLSDGLRQNYNGERWRDRVAF